MYYKKRASYLLVSKDVGQTAERPAVLSFFGWLYDLFLDCCNRLRLFSCGLLLDLVFCLVALNSRDIFSLAENQQGRGCYFVTS